MFNKNKTKIIGGVEHRGNIPKPQGNLLRLIDMCPFPLIIFAPFLLVIIEVVLFACLYSIISSSSFRESFDYSLFSILGETVAESVHNFRVINWMISFQSVTTNCIISFVMAVTLYKLMNLKPQIIKMEEHVVFDPITGTLRLRVVNSSMFNLTNVHIDTNFRLHVPGRGRHANAKLKLKTDSMALFSPYKVWNIATKPFLPECGEKAQLDIDKFDKDRVYEFIPDMLSEKYRSDDAEKAKNGDYNHLNVIITIKSPLFGTDWVYHKSFSTSDFVCGKLYSVDPHEPGKEVIDWSKWEGYMDMSDSHCKECVFVEHCGIIKGDQKYIKIN